MRRQKQIPRFARDDHKRKRLFAGGDSAVQEAALHGVAGQGRGGAEVAARDFAASATQLEFAQGGGVEGIFGQARSRPEMA